HTALGPGASAGRRALDSDAPRNQPPTAALTVTPSSGTEPLSVRADASGSSDPDGTIVSYRFDFGDGTVVGPQPGTMATHTYAAGNWTASVLVTDSGGATATKSVAVAVERRHLPPTASLPATPCRAAERPTTSARAG